MTLHPKLLAILSRLIKWLQKFYSKWNKVDLAELPYTPLSASSNAENAEEYLLAIDWALANRKKYEIYNVALTGPYGSGKSSILKTYMNSRKNQGHHFLPISLATFREEKQDEGDSGTEKNDLLRLIELSILQQIFYHEDDRRIPDSRFRKIKSFSWKQLVLITLCILVFLIAITLLFFPSFVTTLFNLQKSLTIASWLRWVSLLTFGSGVTIAIYRSIRLISGLSIEKLKIHNAEISIDKNISKSILNHHLDEILYFFEATKYDVVIIEDLDRFQETNIFTKLREINLLINNSKKIKREIVFIYAVRDDMFKEDNERTKFFEFIIPVIPIINPNNSSQKLLAKAASQRYQISENLIDTVSSFIDDMRLLHNIINEFFLYRQKINQGLTQDNLLALIIYKNLFPNDFALLSNNKGQLYKVFSETKKQLFQLQNKKLNDLIQQARTRIQELEQIVLIDLIEFRYAYILQYVAKRPGFANFVIAGTDKTLLEMAEEVNFQRLVKDECQYTYYRANYYPHSVTEKIPWKFKDVEKELNERRNYAQRDIDIKDIYSGRTEELKKEIQGLERKIDDLRRLTIRELVSASNHRFEFDNEKQSNLINLLIRNGFIDENYHDYISLFYEGSLTKSDYQFVVNVKTGIDTPFDYILSKTENVIQKINPFDFDKSCILNYQLVDTILLKNDFLHQKDLVFSCLANETMVSVQFINGYMDNGKEPGLLIHGMIKKWNDWWNFIDLRSQFTAERKKQFFKLILTYADLLDIKALYGQDAFKKTLYGYSDILSLIDNRNRLKSIIELLNLKFLSLDSSSPNEMLDFIYKGNYYALNPEMLRIMLSINKVYDELSFTTRNYTAIRSSGAKELISYIQEKIADYVSGIYLVLADNKEETEEALIDLLNNMKLDEVALADILYQTNTKITDLGKINLVETKLIVVKNNKMVAKWENLLDYYQADGSTSVGPLSPFINIIENAESLGKIKIPQDKGDERVYRDFMIKVLSCNEIADKAYDRILTSMSYTFSSLSFEELNTEKVASLVNQRTLAFSKKNFEKLKALGKYHIVFLEKFKRKLLDDITLISPDADDVCSLFQSKELTDEEKNILSEKVAESVISQKAESLEELGRLILRNNSFRVSDTLVQAILVNRLLSNEQRIRVFKWKSRQLNDDQLVAFLNSLQEPYSDITIKGKRPLLPSTEYNMQLVEILKARKFISTFEEKEKGIRVNTFNS